MSNGVIENTNISRVVDGIILYTYEKNIVANSSIFRAYQYGIIADNAVVVSNTISWCGDGIGIGGPYRNNYIANNVFYSNYGWGILSLSEPGNITISNNLFHSNKEGGILIGGAPYGQPKGHLIANNTIINNSCGIRLVRSVENVVIYNEIIHNTQYGIQSYNSTSNKIYQNNIIDNYVGSGKKQAYDDKGKNVWNFTEGNYWSDWTSPDNDHNGIVDTPYVLDGGAGAKDYYPLVNPVKKAGMQTHSISIQKGWNFVSIPLTPSNTKIEEILSPITGKYDSVRFYDSFASNWRSYNPSLSSSNTLLLLNTSMGIWIHMKDRASLTITGTVATSTKIVLKIGWNMVGYPSNKMRTVLQVMTECKEIDIIQGFDAHAPYYLKTLQSNDQLSAGNGYWVHCTKDTVWTVTW